MQDPAVAVLIVNHGSFVKPDPQDNFLGKMLSSSKMPCLGNQKPHDCNIPINFSAVLDY